MRTTEQSESLSTRIEQLASQARADKRSIEARQLQVPDSEQALEFLRTGAGPAIMLYIEGRTGGRMYDFGTTGYEQLEWAMNVWFDCYAACYGVTRVDRTPLRTAAELLIETQNIEDTAMLVTGVPEGRKSNPNRG